MAIRSSSFCWEKTTQGICSRSNRMIRIKTRLLGLLLTLITFFKQHGSRQGGHRKNHDKIRDTRQLKNPVIGCRLSVKKSITDPFKPVVEQTIAIQGEQKHRADKRRP